MSQIDVDKKVLTNNGKDYWRSLDEVAKTPEFLDFLHREFPQDATEVPNSINRRSFAKILAAGAALSGAILAPSCRRPEEKIFPYVNAPEDVIPGKPLFYATTSPRTNGSIGLLVKSNEGRPTKIDGLPNHPTNNGKTDQFAQADILDLYDPNRLQYIYFSKDGEIELPRYKKPLFFGIQQLSKYDKIKNIESRDAYRKELKKANSKGKSYLNKFIAEVRMRQGKGLAILAAPTTSDSEKKLYSRLNKQLPQAEVYFYEPLNDDHASEALQFAYGREKLDRRLNYHFNKARVVLSLDGDFLGTDANHLKHTREFVQGKKIDHSPQQKMENLQVNRLYSVEANYSLTGANADHRIRMQSNKIEDFVYALAKELAKKVTFSQKVVSTLKAHKGNIGTNSYKFIEEVAKDLVNAKGKSIVYVGERQSVQVHLIGLLINTALGNLNNTIDVRQKVTETPVLQQDALSLLTNKMRDKKVSHLLILGGNPVFEAQTQNFAQLLEYVDNSIHLTSMLNDTSMLTTCAIPEAHYLESWGDTRAYDGTQCFIQPLIRPLYKGLTKLGTLAYLTDYKFKKDYDIVKESYGQNDWQKIIHHGYIVGSSYKGEVQATLKYDRIEREIRRSQKLSTKIVSDIELNLIPDYSLYDGRYNNNGWLQELPDPITKLTWDNALLIGYGTAKEKNLKNEQIVEIKVGRDLIEAPIWIVPGIAYNSATLALGYGQKKTGVVGKDTGVSSFALFQQNDYFVNCEINPTDRNYPLANTQDHGSMEDRPIIKEAVFKKFKENPLFAKNQVNLKEPSLFEEREEILTAPRQWGMVIDLNSCIGCAVCTVSCQAENNIPIVGKEQVIKGREMHWIRMDRYFTTPTKNDADVIVDDEVSVVHMPMPCMQCEKAPCEQVCPVAATTHSAEGLNDMTYNRCIGTRYCLNNCPFKVRRFNYFNYQETLKDPNNEVRRMVYNPNVTVRSRGVMEKCTYCVQRINEAKIDAKVRYKGILPEFTTACAQACPADAIVFGDIKDEKSKVSHQKSQSRRYELLPELNIRPRTSFLAQVRNPNENLVEEI